MIKLNTYGNGDCPYSLAFESWMLWEIMTPDPRSSQTVHRVTWRFNWINRPSIWGMIDSMAVDAMENANPSLTDFYRNSAMYYRAGPPYPVCDYDDGVYYFLEPE